MSVLSSACKHVHAAAYVQRVCAVPCLREDSLRMHHLHEEESTYMCFYYVIVFRSEPQPLTYCITTLGVTQV